jgi:hypothetical protein
MKSHTIGTKLHNEELCDLYSSPSIIRMIKSRRMRWTGHVALTGGGDRNACRILVGNPERKRSLGRPRRRWVDNIKMGLREGWYELDRRKALVNTVTNLRIPCSATGGYSRTAWFLDVSLCSSRFPRVTSCLRHIHHMTKRHSSQASVRARHILPDDALNLHCSMEKRRYKGSLSGSVSGANKKPTQAAAFCMAIFSLSLSLPHANYTPHHHHHS